MSEVEALCDRVAILREGRLIEMGTLEDLRHLSALSVQVTFDRVPPDLDGVAGVTRAVVEGRRVYLEVQGPIEPLVDAHPARRPADRNGDAGGSAASLRAVSAGHVRPRGEMPQILQ